MATTLRSEWSPGIVERLRSMGRVIVALMLRETKTRYGRSRFGYLWAVVEPTIYIGFFLAIRSLVRGATGAFGDSLILFLITGLIVVRVFLAVSSFTTASITANKALLTYPPVKPIDVIVARFLLESLTMLFVAVAFLSVIALVLERNILPNYVNFATALLVTFFLAGSMGLFNAVLTVLFSTWQQIWSVLRLPLVIMSGIFYLPTELPPQYQDILWWNPVLHCVEWLRTGAYVTYKPLLDHAYPLVFALLFLAAGLAMERIYRFRLLSA